MAYTAEQVGHLRHALGLDNGINEYRNYFAAGPGSPDDACWAGMVELGLATKNPKPPTDLFPYHCYHATDLGKKVARREVQ